MSLSKVGDSGLVNDACSSEEELFLPKLSHGIQARKKHGSLYCLLYLCILLIISLLCLSTYLALSLKESYHSNVVFQDHVYCKYTQSRDRFLGWSSGEDSEYRENICSPRRGTCALQELSIYHRLRLWENTLPRTAHPRARCFVGWLVSELWVEFWLLVISMSTNMFLPQVGISRIPRDSAAKLMNKTLPIPGEPEGPSFSIGVLARSSKSRTREGRKEETFRLATTLFMLCQNFFFFSFFNSFVLLLFSLSLSPCHVCICIDLGVQWW